MKTVNAGRSSHIRTRHLLLLDHSLPPHGFARPCGPSGAGRPTSDADYMISSAQRASLRSPGAEATQTWTAWNPDESPAPDGCFLMKALPMISSPPVNVHPRLGSIRVDHPPGRPS